eukprot:Opistho-2@36279
MHIIAPEQTAALAANAVNVECFTEYDEYGLADTEACYAVTRLKASAHDANGDSSRAPVDIVAVIDRSGSMGDQNKLELVKQTLEFVTKELTVRDRLAIVSYDDTIRIESPLTVMDYDGKESLLASVRGLHPGGSTNLSGGFLQGLRLMRDRTEAREVSSVLLFTDGLANAGLTQSSDICRMVLALLSNDDDAISKYAIDDADHGQTQQPRRQSFVQRAMNTMGINSPRRTSSPSAAPPALPQSQMQTATFAPPAAAPPSAPTRSPSKSPKAAKASPAAASAKQNASTVYTFGFGSDHDAMMLKAISETGRGMYYFIRGGEDIASSFADCLGGLLSTVAQGITLTLKPANGSAITKIHHVGKVSTVDGTSKIEICDLQSEEERNILFEVKLPARTAVGDEIAFVAEIEYFDVIAGVQRRQIGQAKVRRVSNVSTTRESSVEVDVHKGRMESIKAMDEAKAKADAGDLEAARERISSHISAMKSKKAATSAHAVSANIAEDLEKCLNGLQSTTAYRNEGNQMMSAKQQQWGHERSNECASGSAYETKARKVMKMKFMS